MFVRFLHYAAQCDRCSADFRAADAGDGPAVFVIFAAGALAAPLAILFLLVTRSVLWTGLIFIPLSIGLCLALLSPFKGVLFALQWVNRPGRAVSPDIPGDEDAG